MDCHNSGIEAVSVISEYPHDGGSVCCYYDYHVDTWLPNRVLCCVLGIIGCVMSSACHVEWEYPQDGGRGKKVDGLYSADWLR